MSTNTEIAGMALTLAREIEVCQAELDELKVTIRDFARSANVEKFRIDATSNGCKIGEVTVTFPRDRVTPEGDMDQLKGFLGEETFSLLFEEKRVFTPRRDILSLLKNLPEEKGKEVQKYIKITADTPRVSFPNLKKEA